MPASLADEPFDWKGPAAKRERSSLVTLAKELFIPPKGHRVLPTASGMLVIIIGLCIGLAAYNTENNILFAALSLLVASIIASGLLCWLNFQSARWRIETSPTFRVGESGEVALVVENSRNRAPLYCLRFDLESTETEDEHSVHLRNGLAPGENKRLVWNFVPNRRCETRFALSDAVSNFPFGFLRKHIAGESEKRMAIWPARIAYRSVGIPLGGMSWQGQTVKNRGESGDYIGLREYAKGDPLRSVHWKASAKQRKLVVKQVSAESQALYSIVIDPSAYRWTSEEQFEKMCSFAVSLADDLFLAGQLDQVCIVGNRSIKVDRVADLETFFDEIARLQPMSETGLDGETVQKNGILLEPIEGEGVGASYNGTICAEA